MRYMGWWDFEMDWMVVRDMAMVECRHRSGNAAMTLEVRAKPEVEKISAQSQRFL